MNKEQLLSWSSQRGHSSDKTTDFRAPASRTERKQTQVAEATSSVVTCYGSHRRLPGTSWGAMLSADIKIPQTHSNQCGPHLDQRGCIIPCRKRCQSAIRTLHLGLNAWFPVPAPHSLCNDMALVKRFLLTMMQWLHL